MKKYKIWLDKQTTLSEKTKCDYLSRLKRIYKQSEYWNSNDSVDLFATHILNIIENYKKQNKRNDVAALKNFNKFLYETQFICDAQCVKNTESLLQYVSLNDGQGITAPQIYGDDWLTATETAHVLKTTTKTLREWRQQKKHLPYMDFPYGVRYSRAAINKFLKERFRDAVNKK